MRVSSIVSQIATYCEPFHTQMPRNVLCHRRAPQPVLSRPCFGHVQTIHEHRQFFRTHDYTASLLRAGPAKTTLLQSLGANPQPAAIPHQNLQAASCAIREQEQMTAQRILAQTIANQPVQTVESLAHVHPFDGDVDLRCRAQAKHHAFSATRISRVNSASPNTHPLSMRRPLLSTRAKPVATSAADATSTSTKRCSGRFARRRYRPSVLRSIPVCRQYSICVSPLARYCSSSCAISSSLRRRAMTPVSLGSGMPFKRVSSNAYGQMLKYSCLRSSIQESKCRLSPAQPGTQSRRRDLISRNAWVLPAAST